MSKKRDIDWEAIEREYRAGQLSVREIGRQYGVSHVAILKRVKDSSWERDLAPQVQEEITRAIVTTPEITTGVTNTHTREEDEAIVKAGAERALKVIELHRKDAKKQGEILRDLTSILRKRVPDSETTLDFDDLKDVSTIARNASGALKNLSTIERQAYGIDLKGEGEGGGGEVRVNIINFGELQVSRRD